MTAELKQFERTITEVAGDNGRRWLSNLPELLTECAARWSLQIGSPKFELSYNYVAPAVREDGTAVVLKLGLPGPERDFEREALRLFDGRGMVRLLESEPLSGAMLLERLEPGDPLLPRSANATGIAAGLMRQYWRLPPADHCFPSVADWALGLQTLRDRFAGSTGPMPVGVVEQAEGLFANLIASGGDPVLLHGDLHHGNILSAERAAWLVIDPKGVVGDPAYDAATLLRSLFDDAPDQPDRQAMTRCLDQLSEELHFDRARIAGWAIAQSVLSAWWMIEDHGRDWGPAIACAEFLSTMN